MTLIDRVRALEKQFSEVWKLLTPIRGAGGGGGGGPHNLLSGTHTDTTAGAPVRGDVIVADSNPKWKKLAKAAAGWLLGYDANDVVQIDPATVTVGAATDADTVDGQHAADFQAAGSVAAHHASHEGPGGGAGADKIKLDDLDTPDDNTDLDATPTEHGLLLKLDNTGTKFLRDDGTWQTVTAGASNAVNLWTPDAFPAGAAAQCDHFDDASIDAKWLDFHAGGNQSVAEADHHLQFAQAGDNGAFYCRGKYQALPAGDFTIIAKVGGAFSFANYFELGIMFTQDATNNPNTCDIFTLGYQYEAGGVSLRVQGWNDYATLATNAAIIALNPPPAYLRVRRSGTTITFEYSLDGIYWISPFTPGAQAFAPDGFGLYTSNYSAVAYTAWFDFIFYKGSNDPSPGAMGKAVEFWIT